MRCFALIAALGPTLLALGALSSAGALGCAESRPPPATGNAVSTASGSSAGGASSTNGSTTGQSGESGAGAAGETGAGTTTTSGAGGSGPDEPTDVCGDALVGSTEDCESGVPIVQACAGVGFDAGQLSCAADCSFDTSDCSGSERCFDGRDNDGDRLPDCGDQDCAAACGTSCAEPPVLGDGERVTSTLDGHAAELEASCSGAAGGQEVVFQVTPENTGKLEIVVDSAELTTVSMRGTCAEATSETACASVTGQTVLSLDVVAGEPLFVVVEGYDQDSAGTFSVQVASRPANQCGDAFVDDLEACDDGGLTTGDGCSATCEVESTETEPNDSPMEASAYSDPSWASIAPAGDVDYFQLAVEETPTDVVIDVTNLASGFCTELLMDPYLELRDADGTLVASNDDGGEGYCAKLVATGLSSGQYTIVVRVSDSARTTTRSTFAYTLLVSST